MNLRYFFLIPVLWSLALPAARSQAEAPPLPLSIEGAIEQALENAFSVKIADENLNIARNNNDPGVAGAYPTIDLNFDVNNSYVNLVNPASFLQELAQGNTSLVPGATINWVFFDGGRVQTTRQRLEELERGGEVDLRIAVENTVEAAILSYYQALLRKEQVKVLEEVLTLSRDRIEYEQVKQEFGQASTFDILQTRDAYLNDSLNYIAELTNYANAVHNLNRAMGLQDLQQDYILVDSLIGPMNDYEINTLQEAMLANNNQLANLFVDRELAQLDTRLAQSEWWPQLSVGAGGTYNLTYTLFGTGTFADGNERDLGGLQNRTLNGFVNLRAAWNLFDGGRRKIQVQNARVQELNTQNLIDQTQLDLNTNLLNIYTRYQNEREQVLVTTDLLDNARRNLEIAAERFRGGLINSFDFRTIQLNFINASQSRLSAIFNLKLTETELLRLVGALAR